MIKNWIQKALDFINHSLNPVPQESNELTNKEVAGMEAEK